MRSTFNISVLVIGALLVGVTAGAGPQKSATATADTGRIATNIVHQSAGIRPGEIVLIEGGVRDMKLLEDIAVEVRKIGAHPFITVNSDRLNRMMFVEVDEEFDTQEPEFLDRMSKFIDAKITVDFGEAPDILVDIPAERRVAREMAFTDIKEKMLDRGVVQVSLGNGLYPTEMLAKQYAMSYDKLAELFWAAVNTDLKQVEVIGANVKEALDDGRKLRITAPNGTDLTVDIHRRPIFVSDGIVSSEDRSTRGAACQVWLPAGEVFFTPKPKTAEGMVVFDTFFFEGQRINGLALKFTRGKLTSMTAKSDITALKEAYDAAPMERDWFGAIDIGINPAIMVPSNSLMMTWVGSGTISLGIGNNTWAGGNNDVPYGLYGHLPNGTLFVDGKKIVDYGKLLVK